MNSALLKYVYRSSFSGLNLLGSFQFQAPQIRVLPVPPTINAKLIGKIENCVNQVPTVSADPVLMNATISEIDGLVFEAYGLEPADIEKIKQAF